MRPSFTAFTTLPRRTQPGSSAPRCDEARPPFGGQVRSVDEGRYDAAPNQETSVRLHGGRLTRRVWQLDHPRTSPGRHGAPVAAADMGARWEDAPRRPGGTIRGIDDKTKARYEWGAGRDTQVPAWVADYWAARLRLAEDPDRDEGDRGGPLGRNRDCPIRTSGPSRDSGPRPWRPCARAAGRPLAGEVAGRCGGIGRLPALARSDLGGRGGPSPRHI